MVMKYKPLLLIGVLLIVLGISLMSSMEQASSINQYWNYVDNHYPKIAGAIGAPDGTYKVLITEVHNDSTVRMPLCPSYGGQLHGVWKFDNYTVVFERDKWYHVILKNDIIVQAEEMKT